MADVHAIIDDLRAEGDDLDALVSDLSEDLWARKTPSAGWTVAHQIAHLSWTDLVSLYTSKAAAGDDAQAAEFDRVVAAAVNDPMGFVDASADTEAKRPPAELLQDWRTRRTAIGNALLAVPAGVKITWFGPPMSAASMASARLMETWAHGQDVADALGVVRTPTDRLRNIAHMGVRTRNFAFIVNGRTPPEAEFRVDLTGPRGDVWSWGPADAEQRVSGSAEDFCLLVTQRAHQADLSLQAGGSDAQSWLDIAQVFAGPPGGGRPQKKVSV